MVHIPSISVVLSRGLAITLLLAAPSGAQHLPLVTFQATDNESGDSFGRSVALSGPYCVVGAYQQGTGWYNNTGAAYLFSEAGGSELLKLAPDDIGPADGFGVAVDISGRTAAVSAPQLGGYTPGAVYLFDVPTGTQLRKLVPPDATGGDQFGRSLALEGDLLLVGATRNSLQGTDSGAAYLYDIVTGQLLHRLLASDVGPYDEFGASVALSGSLAVVGAPGSNDLALSSGAVYVFDVISGQQLVKLLASDGGNNHNFGASVSASGSRVVVGAPNSSIYASRAGAAYLFLDVPLLNTEVQLSPRLARADQWFGRCVDIDGSTILVTNGRNHGCAVAYLYDVDTAEQVDLLSSPLTAIANARSNFASDASVDAGRVLCGDPLPPAAAHLYDVQPVGYPLFCFGNQCPCGNDSANSGCVNSTGRGATLDGRGLGHAKHSHVHDPMEFHISGLPPGHLGLMTMGDGVTNLPMGDGRGCMGGSTFQFVNAAQAAAADGRVLLLDLIESSNELIQPGLTWYFQYVYRDPAPAAPCGTGWNLSNAMSVTFRY